MIQGVPTTIWCALYCDGNEAVGDLDLDYGDGRMVSLPLCQECADHLQNNPRLALDLTPVDVLDLDTQDGIGNT